MTFTPTRVYGLVVLLTLFTGQSSALCLGTCTNFGIIASTSISNTGTSSITGACGVWSAGAVTGAPSCSGGTEVNNSVSQTCLANCTAAYDCAIGLAAGNSNSGVLGGQSLGPGTYDITTSATIGAGQTLTLTSTSATAQFIFRIASTFITGIGASIALGGNVVPCNVYFIVGSSATLSASSVIKGNVLALSDITVGNGVNVEGLLCARTGAVTLDADTVLAQTTCECNSPC